MSCRFGKSEAQLLAVCEEAGFINIFRTGEERQREHLVPVRRWAAHRDAIFDICWAMEDRRLLSGSGDYHICYWDTETMKLLSTFPGHLGSVKSISCQVDNNQVFASAGRDGHIMMWDVRVAEQSNEFGVSVKPPVGQFRGAHSVKPTGAGRRTPLAGGGDLAAKSVTSLTFAYGDTMLVSGGADGCVKYWDIRKVSADNQLPPMQNPASVVTVSAMRPGEKRAHGVTSLTLSPCATRLAVRALDEHVYEFDFYRPEEGPIRLYRAPAASFYAKLCYSPSGLHLASGSGDIDLPIFDTSQTPDEPLSPLEPSARLMGHTQPVFAADWSPCGKQMATCSDDGTTRLWTVTPGRPQLKRRRPASPSEAQEGAQEVQDEAPAPAQQRHRGPRQLTLDAFFSSGL